MANSYPHSHVFRLIYDSKKEYFKELRKALKNYMIEDLKIAIKLGVNNAEEIYKCLEEELKAPMSKTRSGIYLLAKEISQTSCFIETLENYRQENNETVEKAVYDWINLTYQFNYIAPAIEEMNAGIKW